MERKWYMQLEGIQEKMDKFKAIGFTGRDVSLGSVLSERVHSLEQLKEIVYKQERDFLASFAVTSFVKDDPRAALDTLQMYVGIWNTSGARKMVSKESVNTVLEILTSGEYQKITGNDLEDVASELIQQEPSFLQEGIEQVNEKLIDTLNEVLEKNGQKKLA